LRALWTSLNGGIQRRLLHLEHEIIVLLWQSIVPLTAREVVEDFLESEKKQKQQTYPHTHPKKYATLDMEPLVRAIKSTFGGLFNSRDGMGG